MIPLAGVAGGLIVAGIVLLVLELTGGSPRPACRRGPAASSARPPASDC